MAKSKFILNLVPSKGTETDWTFQDSVSAGALGAVAAPPPAVDLRGAWWPVGNQGNTGSCVGWATGDGLGRYHMVKAGRIPQNGKLSPRYMWMASKETDVFTARPQSFIEEAGTSLKAAVDIARKYGFALETQLPFKINTNMHVGSENAFYASCAQRRVASYFNLKRVLPNWKTWLASNGPILAGFAVDASWDAVTPANHNVDVFQPGTVRGGHAVAIVGYRTDGRFIVRNSWGDTWGDKGFCYVSPGYIQGAFFDESYGVTV
jgi:C1A family cysteine protease